jgi:hypothetical protein
MRPPHRVLEAIVASLRQVIAPAIADPYPRAQAYMAAVILEYVARQVEERRDLEAGKAGALEDLFRDLAAMLEGQALPGPDAAGGEARLCRMIEWLYAERERLGPERFAAASGRVRRALRQLLDEELKVAAAPARAPVRGERP